MFLFLFLMGVVGATVVTYSLSPYFGSLGLVLLSLCLCCLLGYFGFSFLGLVLLLTYLGGMMVVFIYSSALASDKYPKVGSWTGVVVTFFSLVAFLIFLKSSHLISGVSLSSNFNNLKSLSGGSWLIESFLEKGDWGICGLLYSSLFPLLFLVGLALMAALIFVLVMTFGSYNKSLRALGFE